MFTLTKQKRKNSILLAVYIEEYMLLSEQKIPSNCAPFVHIALFLPSGDSGLTRGRAHLLPKNRAAWLDTPTEELIACR